MSREDAATWLEREREEEGTAQQRQELEHFLRKTPRMMHQTSSRLLRMANANLRPYSKVRDLLVTFLTYRAVCLRYRPMRDLTLVRNLSMKCANLFFHLRVLNTYKT